MVQGLIPSTLRRFLATELIFPFFRARGKSERVELIFDLIPSPWNSTRSTSTHSVGLAQRSRVANDAPAIHLGLPYRSPPISSLNSSSPTVQSSPINASTLHNSPKSISTRSDRIINRNRRNNQSASIFPPCSSGLIRSNGRRLMDHYLYRDI